jgi:hypothetical protein
MIDEPRSREARAAAEAALVRVVSRDSRVFASTIALGDMHNLAPLRMKLGAPNFSRGPTTSSGSSVIGSVY